MGPLIFHLPRNHYYYYGIGLEGGKACDKSENDAEQCRTTHAGSDNFTVRTRITEAFSTNHPRGHSTEVFAEGVLRPTTEPPKRLDTESAPNHIQWLVPRSTITGFAEVYIRLNSECSCETNA